MTETLSFPGLGLDFNIRREAFYLPDFLGGFPIYWYGVIIASAFVLATLYMMKRIKAFGLDLDRFLDVALVSILGGILGARLYYVAFSWSTYSGDLLSIFNIRAGGLAIYGGIIGAFLTGLIMCKVRRVKTLPAFDIAAGCILLGQGIGRWGNFINIEAFGSNTNMPWGMISPSTTAYLSAHRQELAAIGVAVDPSQPVHPTFFYESIWCLLGFAFMAWFTSRRRFDGQLTLIYLVWYGAGRFWIEGLRTDSLMLGTLRVSQIVALLCVLASGITLVVVLSKIKRENNEDYLKLYVNTEEGQQVLAGEYYKQFEKKKKDNAEDKAGDSGDGAGDGQDADAGEGSDGTAEPDAGGEGTPSDDDGPAGTEETDGAASRDGDEEAEDNGEDH